MKREVIFRHKDKWYSIDFEYIPEKFKRLYVFKLKLEGYKIPEDLLKYDTDTINTDTTIEIDETKAVEIQEEYPISVE